MSSTVAVFLKGWQLEQELGQLAQLSAAGGNPALAPVDAWYWVIAGGDGRSRARLIEQLKLQGIHAATGRVFAPQELQDVKKELASARPLADYLLKRLWAIARKEHERLFVRWPDDWLALISGVSSIMGLQGGLSWWHPKEAAPALALPVDTVLDTALRPRQASKAMESLVGQSPLMERLREILRARAPLPFPVLLIGETGSGKELAARVLHEESGRKGRFVPVNAALLGSDRMAESELFGHVENAYTDAKKERPGRIREAEDGTFFLDELDSLPRDMQARLLRAMARVNAAVIEVTPLGAPDDRRIEVPVRFVAALQRNPLELEDFRRDLYFRIATIQIEVPPLRLRDEDVLALAKRELGQLAGSLSGGGSFGFADDAQQIFREYRWPGNVRELQRMVLLGFLAARDANRREIQAEDVRPHLIDTTKRFTDQGSLEIQVAKYQLAAGEYALARHPGNKAAAARELGYKTGQELERMMDVARKRLG